jgi:hypothetical protein
MATKQAIVTDVTSGQLAILIASSGLFEGFWYVIDNTYEIRATSVNTYIRQDRVPIERHFDAVYGDHSYYIGENCGINDTTYGSTAIGESALKNNTGIWSTGFGNKAGMNNVGQFLTSIGEGSGRENFGEYCTFLGVDAGLLNKGDDATACGMSTLIRNTGDKASAVGWYSGDSNCGNMFVGMGYQTGATNEGDNNIFIGSMTGRAFVQNENTKIFSAASVIENTINIPAHGFGANGSYRLLRVVAGEGSIGNLTSGVPDKFKIIDEDNIELVFGSLGEITGTGHQITPKNIYSNVILIGHGVEPEASNQTIIGNDLTISSLIRGKIGIGQPTGTIPLTQAEITGTIGNPAILTLSDFDAVSALGQVFGGIQTRTQDGSIGTPDRITGRILSVDEAGNGALAGWVFETAYGGELSEKFRIGSGGLLKSIGTPTFADNATAISGGLIAGNIYKTATGELRIVI